MPNFAKKGISPENWPPPRSPAPDWAALQYPLTSSWLRGRLSTAFPSLLVSYRRVSMSRPRDHRGGSPVYNCARGLWPSSASAMLAHAHRQGRRRVAARGGQRLSLFPMMFPLRDLSLFPVEIDCRLSFRGVAKVPSALTTSTRGSAQSMIFLDNPAAARCRGKSPRQVSVTGLHRPAPMVTRWDRGTLDSTPAPFLTPAIRLATANPRRIGPPESRNDEATKATGKRIPVSSAVSMNQNDARCHQIARPTLNPNFEAGPSRRNYCDGIDELLTDASDFMGVSQSSANKASPPAACRR